MQVTLCNPDHQEYGVATIPFPIPDEEYGHCVGMLKLLEIGGVTDRDCYVDQIMGAPPVLDFLEGSKINVDELDFLARSIDRYTDEELAKFQCTAAARGYTDMTDLINLSFCCEETSVITDFTKLEEAGKSHYMTTHGGSVPVGEYDQLNGVGIARGLIAGGEGKITPYGVVFENSTRLEPLYSGHSFPPYLDRPYFMQLEIKTPQDETPVELFLSVPELRLERLLERAGIRSPEDLKICSWRSELPDQINDRLNIPHEGLYELNRLFQAVEKLDAAQIKKLSAVVQYAEPEYAMQIRHLAENLKQFEFVPDVKTPEEYGRHMIEESGHFEYDPNLDEYYDFEKYGKDRIASQEGQFNAEGYVAYHGVLSLDELMMEDPTEQSQGMQMGGLTKRLRTFQKGMMAMATPVPYRVLVTTDKGMNIILSNKSLENERTYSHFVRAQEAERFAEILETLLDKAEYTKLDRCFICGDPFFKEDDICRLINGAEAHNKCFHAMVKKDKLTYDDRTERRANPFPEDRRQKDFSNLDSGDKCFRYEMEIVSKTVIHLWLREFYGHQTHHFCMTYDECRGFISAVREKLKAIEKARIGTCVHCSDSIYADQTCYTFASGELIHSKCMEQFVCGEHTGEVTFPVTRRKGQDLFGHIRMFPELYNREPFPVE